jgi:hypothetical protein
VALLPPGIERLVDPARFGASHDIGDADGGVEDGSGLEAEPEPELGPEGEGRTPAMRQVASAVAEVRAAVAKAFFQCVPGLPPPLPAPSTRYTQSGSGPETRDPACRGQPSPRAPPCRRVLAVNERAVLRVGAACLVLRVVRADIKTAEEQEELAVYHCYRGLVRPPHARTASAPHAAAPTTAARSQRCALKGASRALRC